VPESQWDMEEEERAAHLFAGAAWQDSLLQSYRSLHLALQAIFLAIATGLVIAALSFADPIDLVLIGISFASFFIVGLWSLLNFRRLILARGADVNYWHRQLLRHEASASPRARILLMFKVHQKLDRTDGGHLQNLLTGKGEMSDEDLDELVSKGLGHTRRAIDVWLSLGLGFTWILLAAVLIVAVLT